MLLRSITITVGVLFAFFLFEKYSPSAPTPPLGCDPIDAHDLSLSIVADGSLCISEGEPVRWEVSVILHNNRNAVRSLDNVYAYGNRIDACVSLSYIFWFPDGAVIEMGSRAGSVDPWGLPRRCKLLTLPAGGEAYGQYSLWRIALSEEFQTNFKKNKGQFCMTAVIGSLELQSNTISFNKCPSPPSRYVPLRHSENTPEAQDREKNRIVGEK